jgi:class 3 adenylate cyclase
VQRLLGEGGKKRVYLARDQSLGRDVAVSEIKTAGVDDPGQLRVRHEAEAMAKLGDHANVVTVFDIGNEDGQLFIVSEFMAGGDVEGRLREAEGGRLSIDEALRVAREVCGALEHAHGQGIIHRDLKPGNIWLRRDGSAALGDFGLALSEDRSRVTQEGMMVGTVAYMPPEQALGRQPDARSDLYALGVSLYEMVAGRTPFGGDDAVSIISQHINTPPVAPSWHNGEIPKPLDDLILKLLAKDPAQRPQTAAEAGRTLEAITGASTVSPAAEPASANPLERLASGIFVGREKELEQLRGGVDAVLSGKGRIVFLVGEPGIGKTRTSEEISTYAGLRGAQVLWGRCYEGEGAPTYWPWVQIVRSYVGERDPAALLSEMGGGASVIADVVSEVRERLPGLQPAAPLGAEEARFRLFDTLTSFFKNASRQHPLVLILDDLHWADKPSLMLLQFLGRELTGSRILVVGTYRDVELGRRHPLADALAELSRAELSQRVLLRGLEERDVARFIELSSGREAPAALVTAVYRETEGNPFFVQEVVQLLAADGRLDDPKTSGTWSVAIPQGIREAVGRRLNHLSDDCNELLALGSVIGREFDLALLEKVSDKPGDRVVELLDEALAARVVEEMAETPGRYRFSHALVKETLHDELNTTRRVRLHRKIGETLEALHGERVEPQLATLAYHFAEGAHAGGDVDKAVAYSRRAGERATALMAHEDAIPHYERALQMLDLQGGADPQQRCDMLLALAWAHNYGGDAEESVAKMEAAVPIARKLDDPRRLALVAASYGFAEFARNLGRPHPGATAVLEEARDKLGDEDTIERAQVTTQLGLQLVLGATADRGGELLSEAVEIARRVGHKPTLVETLFNVLWSIWRAEDMDRKLALAHEMLELAEEIGNTDRMVEARVQLFHVLYAKGDFEGCRRQDAAVEELASRTQNARAMYWHHLHRAMWAVVAGDLDKAERLAGEALAFGTRVWNYVAENQYGAQFSSIRIFQGRLEEMAGLLDAFVEQHHQIAWLAAAAYAHAALGNEEAARRYLDPFLADDFASMTPDGNWPTGMGLLAQAVYELGDAEAAPRLYELLLPYAELLIFAGGAATPLSPGHRVLGLLAHTMGRLDDAVAHLDRASELMRQWGGIRPVEGRMGLEFARLLLERKAAGDSERALRILNESIDAGRDIGAPSLVEAALSLKLETQGIDATRTNLSIYAVAHSVQARRPDLVDHAAPDGSVTLMFSDMEGFTSMTERLGDEAAHALIREHNRILRDRIENHGGREVDSQGDGFLVAFKNPHDGVRAAVALQQAFTTYCEANPEEPIRVRVGLHTGQAIRDAEKFFGRTVIMACRIADQARATEILVSEDVRNAVEGEFAFGDCRDLTLKGFSGTHAAHAVAWA